MAHRNEHALATLRRDMGLNVRQFARKLRVSPGTVVDWEHSRTRPQPRHLRRLSRVLGLSIRRVNEIFRSIQAAAA